MALQGARIVYLPEGVENIRLVNLPHPRTGESHNYVLADEQLYELKQIDGDNPHLKGNHLRPTTKTDNKPVRSLILENLINDEEGLVLEESNLIISTRFNFVYTLIRYFQDKSSKRFQSLEDLTDEIEQTLPIISSLPTEIITQGLTNISQTIQENDETFYRYSEEVTLTYLKSKVDDISQSFPKSIHEKLIKPSLYPLNIEDPIPDDITSSALIIHSIHLLSSYLSTNWQTKLLDSYKTDTDKLDAYLTKLQRQKVEKKAAEDQLSSLNQLNAQNRRNLDQISGPIKKKPTPQKKVIAKVSRGPLDAFLGKRK